MERPRYWTEAWFVVVDGGRMYGPYWWIEAIEAIDPRNPNGAGAGAVLHFRQLPDAQKAEAMRLLRTA